MLFNKKTTKTIAELSNKEVNFFIDQRAELLLKQIEEAADEKSDR